MSISKVADWMTSLQLKHIPDRVLEHTKLILLDTISVMIKGNMHPGMEALIKRLSEQYPGEGMVLGKPYTVLPEWAAFINATGGSFLELDEGQRPTGHPAIHVIPSALAFASHLKRSGIDFYVSVITGYEIQSRISQSVKLRWEIHPHGNLGTTAAAAALGLLNRKNSKELAELINISTTLSLGTSWTPCFEGATVRNTYAGVSALMANLANNLVAAKFTGLDNALMDVYNGGILGNEFNMTLFTEKLGDTYSIENNYFKFHACCALNHSPLDAVQELMANQEISIHDITKIIVEGNKGNVRLAQMPVKDQELAYKFSIPYAVAALLYYKNTNLEAFSPNAYEVLEIQRLAEKIEVIENEWYTEAWPSEAKSRVTILTGKNKYVAECSNPYGSGMNKASAEAIYQKSERLMYPYITNVNAYFTLFENLMEYQSMGIWLKDLQKLFKS